MNIQHLRYAVTVARARSITEAAEQLYMGQPNLSRAIRELEEELGVSIFRRTPQGVVPTPQGEEFLHYARGILAQFDEMTARYRTAREGAPRFSVSVPRASYIAAAFTRLAASLAPKDAPTLVYKETNALRAIKNVTQGDYSLGIIRYQLANERYFLDTLREQGLRGEALRTFRYLALMSREHPLAGLPAVPLSALSQYCEILHGDTYVPMPQGAPRLSQTPVGGRQIYIFERASQFQLLQRVPGAFMWVSPVPGELLERFGLVQRPCEGDAREYRDALICKQGYALTQTDEQFRALLLEEIARA